MVDAGIAGSLHGERGAADTSFSDGGTGSDGDSVDSGFATDEGGAAAAWGVESDVRPQAAVNRMTDSRETDLRKFMRADLGQVWVQVGSRVDPTTSNARCRCRACYGYFGN